MSLKDNKEVMLRKIQEDPYNLYVASDRLKNDRDIVLEAVKQKGETLKGASKELRNDPEIVLVAIQQNKDAQIHIGEKLKEKIGEHDPIKYLETELHRQQLDRELAPKTEVKHTKHVSKI